jgi:hypothetical protein
MAADLAEVGQEQMQAVREMVEAKSREMKRLLD